jgi:hypothetical protein
LIESNGKNYAFSWISLDIHIYKELNVPFYL